MKIDPGFPTICLEEGIRFYCHRFMTWTRYEGEVLKMKLNKMMSGEGETIEIIEEQMRP